MKATRIIWGMFLLLIAGVVLAQGVPQLINFQGRLTDDAGLPIDGPVEMRFRLLDADTLSASVLWSETHASVSVNNGIYHLILGSVNPLPPSALSVSDIYLEIRVEGEILRPRSQITSVPFAHKAAGVPDGVITSAMIADGTVTGSDIDSQTITSTNIADETITSTQIQDLSINGSDLQDNSLGTAQIQDIYVLNAGDTVFGDLQVNGSQSIGLDLTVSGGNIGIGTAPDPSCSIINQSGGAPAQGALLYGSSAGVKAAWSSDPVDHYAYLGTETYGVYASSGNSDEVEARVGGRFWASSQNWTYGVYTEALCYGNSAAVGVESAVSNFSSGDAYGGRFSTSTLGTGIHYGVYAEAQGGLESYGVYGYASGSYSGNDYGIYNAAGIKSWVNPDPEDPSKSIVYATLEGGENGTYWRGTARLERGRAVVIMPDHFRKVTSPDHPVTVTLAPRGECSGLMLVETGNERIVVKEMMGGTSDVEFDFIIMGKRLGYEDHDPVIDNVDYVPFQGHHSGMDGTRITTQEWYNSHSDGLKRIFRMNGTLKEDGSINEALFREKGWKVVKEESWE